MSDMTTSSRPSSSTKSDRTAEISRQAINVMHERLGEHLTLQSIADAIFVSRTSLCNAFKAENGISVGEYLRNIRIEKAQDLLANTSLPISAIADGTGYSRQSSFTEAFKDATGITPSEWRYRAKAQQ